MHDFLIFLAATFFGVLAWAMLEVSDWLLRDQEPRHGGRGTTLYAGRRHRLIQLAYHR